MVTYKSGDIFRSPAQVITNTVNCVGVMGKGLALEFKNRYPDMFREYKARCERGEVRPGKPYLFENNQVEVLNFPTKRDWRENSRLEDIEAGLKYLAENYAKMGIFFLALPPLGCGLGGLHWPDVRSLIEKYLAPIQDLEVFVYEPAAAQSKTPSDSEGKALPKTGSGLAAQP